MKLAEKVKEFFHNEGIHSTTIQPEFVEVEVCVTQYINYILINFIIYVNFYFVIKYYYR